MKRMFCLALCSIMLVMFTACQNEVDGEKVSSLLPTSSTVSVDIVDLASKGKIDGCEFDIGTLPETIKEEYHYGDEEYWGMDETASSRYNIDAVELDIKDGDPVRMSTADAKYYYRVSDADKGVSFIAYFYDAYGLRVGISDTQTVKDAVKATPVYDGFAESDDLFIFFGEPADVYMLSYSIEDYELSFYFENGKLSATSLKKTSLWG